MDNLLKRNLIENQYYKMLKYIEVLKISFMTNTTYFGANIADGFIFFLRIWIYTQLYQATYHAVQTDQVAGFSIAMVVWMLMFTQVVSGSVRPSVAKQIQEEIKDGTVALKICRPYSFLFFNYFELLGRFFSNIMINLSVGILAVLILVGPIAISPKAIIFGTILLFLGIFIDFLCLYFIGLLAFWIEDVRPVIWIYSKGLFIMGGMIFPIALFPESFRKIAELLPFSQMFYGASRIFVRYDQPLFQKYLLLQIFWIAFFYIACVLLYKKGVKNVNINGG